MPPALPSFSVCAMVRETPEVIQRFVDFYRAAGAERVLLFVDGPIGDMAGTDLGDAEVQECDPDFWQGLCGGRPRSLSAAQEAVYMRAVELCPSDWLFIADADEFVVGDRPIRVLLGAVPSGVHSLRIRTAEAVWGPSDDIGRSFGCSHFRTRMPHRLWRLVGPIIYGRLWYLFRNGLIAHQEGKQFVRKRGRFTQILNHDSIFEDRNIGRWAHQISTENVPFVVAHFDAIGFERWHEKWRRRFSGEIDVPKMGGARSSQMELIRGACETGDEAARRLFERFYRISRFQKALLRATNCLIVMQVFEGASRPEAPPADASQTMGGSPGDRGGRPRSAG